MITHPETTLNITSSTNRMVLRVGRKHCSTIMLKVNMKMQQVFFSLTKSSYTHGILFQKRALRLLLFSPSCTLLPLNLVSFHSVKRMLSYPRAVISSAELLHGKHLTKRKEEKSVSYEYSFTDNCESHLKILFFLCLFLCIFLIYFWLLYEFWKTIL